MPKMRAKLMVTAVVITQGQEEVKMSPVCGSAPFGEKGESEDNTFARYTPCGALSLIISNPDLHGQFKPGQKFYADFTEAAE
jgi:hypothetical protein